MITYKKSQVLYALWNTLRNPANYEKKPSPIFARRLDKLQSVNVPLLPEERTGQAGYDNEFTEPQVFLIAIALILMDSGFGLGTAGFFIHHARPSLLKQYERIMKNKPSALMAHEDEDKTIWLILQNKDLQELYPAHIMKKYSKGDEMNGWSGKGPAPLIINPTYAFGKDRRNKVLDMTVQGGSCSHALVLEIAKMASVLTDTLQTAPVLKRGRHK
ncbi:hypothetical protein [Acetobacter orientalis]|uniref:hypothetical protein n=1 Tax=Acetobacter orientalis TaxID=146474 RepID=UPI0039ED6DA1